MAEAILNRRPIPKYSYLNHLLDKMIVALCCCCKSTRLYKRSHFNRQRRKKINSKLVKELDIVQVLQQLRILQFLSTALLRRNQTELVPYSAQYNMNFDFDEDGDVDENSSRDFEFNANQARSIPQLLLAFEARTDTFDRNLLYFLTDKEIHSCM